MHRLVKVPEVVLHCFCHLNYGWWGVRGARQEQRKAWVCVGMEELPICVLQCLDFLVSIDVRNLFTLFSVH